MIPEFLQDLLHNTPESKVFSADNGVYVVAESFEEAQRKILEACGEDVFELIAVTPLRTN